MGHTSIVFIPAGSNEFLGTMLDKLGPKTLRAQGASKPDSSGKRDQMNSITFNVENIEIEKNINIDDAYSPPLILEDADKGDMVLVYGTPSKWH